VHYQLLHATLVFVPYSLSQEVELCHKQQAHPACIGMHSQCNYQPGGISTCPLLIEDNGNISPSCHHLSNVAQHISSSEGDVKLQKLPASRYLSDSVSCSAQLLAPTNTAAAAPMPAAFLH
jgi:hypothetical protein